ncbi:hypothetical protein [Brachybacterium sp. GCM10030252]|uniref:hypothetical protein n=1 Tax=Brachybacterium sp. GCM10030252 TaxID=3273380 RepID=UPI003618A88A
MDSNGITSALMRQLLEETRVRPFGEGFLVDTPLAYSDGDTVTIGVFPLGGGFRVTDRAEAIDRLGEAGVGLAKTNRTTELIDMLRRRAQLSPVDAHELEVADYVSQATLAAGILHVARVAQSIEHLRWTMKEPTPQPYRDVVIAEAQQIARRHHWNSRANARVHLRGGQERRFTATVNVGKRTGYVQALALSDRNAAVEHAYYMFSELDAEREAKLAVVDMRSATWPEADLSAIERTGTVVQFRRPDDLEQALVRLEAPALA